MHRRTALALAALPLGTSHLAALSAVASATKPLRLAAGWRTPTSLGHTQDRVGIVEVDWARQAVRIVAELPTLDRVHGLVAMPDGGFIAVATRPGHWLIRCDAQGRVMARVIRGQELPHRTFNGHAVLSHDGQWLFTTETSSPTGMAWVSVRDARNLHRVMQFLTAGFDAHHVVLDPEGKLLIANGGILRDQEGAKIAPDRMRPSLAHVDPETTEIIGQWRLQDQRLSIRHLAWSRQPDGKSLLGVGLQAEHDDAHSRRQAPALAILRDGRLILPTPDSQTSGFVGDIAAAPSGGFLLSGEKSARGLWWNPRSARTMTKVVELEDACALAVVSDDAGPGAVIGSAKGVALWRPSQPVATLPWPTAMRPDNHWVVLRAV
jgi:uncharacterized protein